ncbi:MAG TPA: WYL domain-containing protein [Bacteroidales bacterium]|nr:WYL domain-containing protein [Bacteroidales bacterium]
MTGQREARIRYSVINRCLSGGREMSLSGLAVACSEALGGKPVDKATIETDLKAMQSGGKTGYGAPVEEDKARGTFRYSDPEYSIEKTPLNKDDARDLSSAATLLEQLSSRGLFMEMGGVLQKLIDVTRINTLGKGRNIWDFVQFEKVPSTAGSTFLEPVIEAILRKQVLKIYYKPYEEEKPYFTWVHPYLLKEFRYRWYLVGLNEQRNSPRTYALDRIWEIEVTDHTFISSDFKARDYFRHSVGVIVPQGEPREVLLEVRKPQAHYLITQPLHESQVIQEETDEHIVFSFHVHPTWEFKSMIRALGSEARILMPAGLREEMIGELKATLKNYGDNA